MAIEFHMIWRDQIEAVSAIRQRHGEAAAFDYIVDEKLMNFAEAAEGRPEFARELPRFVAAIREVFPSDTMRSGLQRLAHYLEEDEARTAEMLREKQANPSRKGVDDGDGNGDTDDDFEDAETLATRMQSLSSRQKRSNFYVNCSSLSGSAQLEAAYRGSGHCLKTHDPCCSRTAREGAPRCPRGVR